MLCYAMPTRTPTTYLSILGETWDKWQPISDLCPMYGGSAFTFPYVIPSPCVCMLSRPSQRTQQTQTTQQTWNQPTHNYRIQPRPHTYIPYWIHLTSAIYRNLSCLSRTVSTFWYDLIIQSYLQHIDCLSGPATVSMGCGRGDTHDHFLWSQGKRQVGLCQGWAQ